MRVAGDIEATWRGISPGRTARSAARYTSAAESFYRLPAAREPDPADPTLNLDSPKLPRGCPRR